MMRLMFMLVCLVATAREIPAQEPSKSDAGAKQQPAPKEPGLVKELANRIETEQAARKALIAYQIEHKIENGAPLSAEFHALAKKVEELDVANTAWMKEVIAKHGWPGKSLVGTAGAGNAWLLVQHADRDRDFQEMCLKKMEAMPKGEVEPRHVAYLTDRVLVGRGKKQRFGTQTVIKEGKAVPSPIEDEATVDERRKAIGLEPLTDYLRAVEAMYTKPPKPEPKGGATKADRQRGGL